MQDLLGFLKKVNQNLFQKEEKEINHSDYVSRDLSWLTFNERVLDQARKPKRSLFDRLKFLAISASNLDEFFMIRVGSLYNYLDFGKERVDYSGLNAEPFKKKLLADIQKFVSEQYKWFQEQLIPEFEENGFKLVSVYDLKEEEREIAFGYFNKTIYPMLTPMLYDSTHTFPVLVNKVLIFGVVTKTPETKDSGKDTRKITFVQVPQNLPRFFEIQSSEGVLFLPVEEIIRWQIQKLFRNVEIVSVSLFRIIRNGDFVEDSEDVDLNFIDEIKRKINTRKTGRVVRLEIEPNYSGWMIKLLKEKFEIDEFNIFEVNKIIDLTAVLQILKYNDFKSKIPSAPKPVTPVNYANASNEPLFDYLKHHDLLMHHPYNSMEPVLQLLESAAVDPGVLAIKITIYRLAKDSRITSALLKAANNGKNVSVLFEVKARFDEEHNIKEAERLQKAGCFVIYGVGRYKTHTKLMLIVRQEENNTVTRYVHISSGNYNEITANFYTDLGLLTTKEAYANDVSEFFNVITGHSQPDEYQYLITAPHHMRKSLIRLIRAEADHAREGNPAGIIFKLNSLQDKEIIDELYQASKAGVHIQLIVRGICCLRPKRKDLSENIMVKSVVGDFLEHTRIFYFQNKNEPLIYSGSADAMVRSFDRRIESLYLIAEEILKKEVSNILMFNLKDTENSYEMNEDGSYSKVESPAEGGFDVHKAFYHVKAADLEDVKLFEKELV